MKRNCFLFALGLFVGAVPVWAQDFDLQHFRWLCCNFGRQRLVS